MRTTIRLLAFVSASIKTFLRATEDPNQDIKDRWCLLHDDTQPIPVIR